MQVFPTLINKRTKKHKKNAHSDVPQLEAGFPIIMLSETPEISSVLPMADASKRWSVVFSKDASINTLSFIFATPNRVIPRTSPWTERELETILHHGTHLVRHHVTQQHYVAWVDAHSV